MINVKAIYAELLTNEKITALVSTDNIMSSWPNEEIENFPCIIFTDDNQSDTEYWENKPGASSCSVMIHIFSKKLDGYATTTEIAELIAEVMNDKLWNCSRNGETADPDPDVEHRVMAFNTSIFYN